MPGEMAGDQALKRDALQVRWKQRGARDVVVEPPDGHRRVALQRHRGTRRIAITGQAGRRTGNVARSHGRRARRGRHATDPGNRTRKVQRPILTPSW